MTLYIVTCNYSLKTLRCGKESVTTSVISEDMSRNAAVIGKKLAELERKKMTT
jgi:hypothetical protein